MATSTDSPPTTAGVNTARTLAVGCLAYGMTVVDTTIVNVALPSIQSDVGAGVATLQWIVDGYVLVLAALLLSGGALVDRFGAARVLRTGIVVFTVASALCAAAWSGPALVSARIIQGLGAAMLIPATLAVVAQAFPAAAGRARAIAIVATVAGSPQAFGPTLGGGLVDAIGWRSIFLVNLPLGAAALVLALRGLPGNPPNRNRTLDLLGQAIAAGALGALTYGLIEAGRAGWGSPSVAVALSVGVALAVAFVVVEHRVGDPVLPPDLLRSRQLLPYVSTGLLLFITYYGLLFTVNLYFQRFQGLSALDAGLRLLPAAIPVFVLPLLISRLARKVGAAVLTGAGLALGVAGALSFLLVDEGTSGIITSIALILVGSGVGVATAPQIALVLSASPPARAGIASGLVNVGRQSGLVIGVALLGGLVSGGTRWSVGLHHGAWLAAAASLLGLIVLVAAALGGRTSTRTA
ncbi:MFS transporter [Plantactinospora sp. KBS50]|uniref:MFS transporter n=1 Tax=Plantactinospora sp. KBS50 TaxID=2024580 RepID=UPI000BAAD3C0|nr:MFS transporter [Plantactinospora sp. KBS50]ASW53292.1 hypothetical protein CIK06_02490 [Plantactinospora sp. KBS50]